MENKMNIKIFKKVIIAVVLIFTTSSIFAQDIELENNPFEIFKEYSNFGINISPRLQFKSTSNNTIGSDPFIHNSSFGLGLGVTYILRPANTWSYRIGTHYNINDESNFKLKNDSRNISFKSTSSSISIPIEIEYKKLVSKNLIWTTKAGVNVTFIDGFDSASIDYEDFSLVYKPQSDFIYPNLLFCSGVYFVFKPFMLQTSLIFQKNIPSFIEGNYEIVDSNNSIQNKGTYKMTGDYIGLEFIVFLKKSKK